MGLLNIFQDIAGLHADELGFGYEEMIKNQQFWVLLKLEVQMDSWPKWKDLVEVKTWSRPLEGMTAYRDFEIYLEGKLIGTANTAWIILSGETRKPIRLKTLLNPSGLREDFKLPYTASKIHIPSGEEPLRNFKVEISDLDMNMHVNNTKYTQWALNSLPLQLHQNFELKKYEINILKETFLYDSIKVLTSKENKYKTIWGVNEKSNEKVFVCKFT